MAFLDLRELPELEYLDSVGMSEDFVVAGPLYSWQWSHDDENFNHDWFPEDEMEVIVQLCDPF